jgi:hypothetical protein
MSDQWEHVERTHAYAAEVAKALGDGWTYTRTFDGDGKPTWFATLTGPNGASLHLSRESRTGRYQWSGNYPRDAKGQDHKPYNATRPEISTSPEKTPVQAARDITRRLLPDYLALLARCQEGVDAANTYVDTTARNVARLAEILGREPDKRPTSGSEASVRFYWRGGDTYGDVMVNGNHVRIDVKLPMDQAERLLPILRDLAI